MSTPYRLSCIPWIPGSITLTQVSRKSGWKGSEISELLSYLTTGVVRMQDKMATDYKKFDRKYFIFATSIARSVSALNDSLLAIHRSADVDQYMKDLVISEVYMCCVVLCECISYSLLWSHL